MVRNEQADYSWRAGTEIRPKRTINEISFENMMKTSSVDKYRTMYSDNLILKYLFVTQFVLRNIIVPCVTQCELKYQTNIYDFKFSS